MSSKKFNLIFLAAMGAAAAGLAGAPVYASVTITGFNNFQLNTNGKSTGQDALSNGNTVLQLTDATVNEASSAFHKNLVPYAKGFTAAFTYQDANKGTADGVAFVVQNDTYVTNPSTDKNAYGIYALGQPGGDLGYNGTSGAYIHNSAALELDIHSKGTNFATEGSTGTYNSTGSVNLASGDPIFVTLAFDGSALTETLVDQTTPTDNYTASYTTNLANVGSSTAYVGFTGGDGGSTSIQQISDFTYTGISAAPEPSEFGMIGLIGIGLSGLLLKARKRCA